MSRGDPVPRHRSHVRRVSPFCDDFVAYRGVFVCLWLADLAQPSTLMLSLSSCCPDTFPLCSGQDRCVSNAASQIDFCADVVNYNVFVQVRCRLG